MSSFIFEAASSDEERDLHEEEEESEHDSEEGELSDDESKPQATQSPWDFTKYSESVAEEHARRSTTSLDFKIDRARQELEVPVVESEEEEESSDSEVEQNVREIHLLCISISHSVGLRKRINVYIVSC